MIIRKANLQDANSIATYMLLAMKDIVYQFIGEKNEAKAKEFMLHFTSKKNNQYSWQNCWVAEQQKEVVAAVNIFDGAKLGQLREPVINYIRSYFNPGFQPEDETAPGEFYIDTIAVNPNLQGKGIGSSMLQFLKDEYVNRQGKVLGLLVDEENPNARKLYLEKGFKPMGSKVLYGKLMAHLQF